MRIAYLCQYFHPEPAAPSARLLDLGRAWTRMGHEVTVVTGLPNHPTGVVPAAYSGRLSLQEQLDGMRVLRTWLYATPNRGRVRKGLNHLSFALSAWLLNLRRLGPVDVLIASSPSLLSVVSGLALARAWRAPLLFEVRDLWPAAMADLDVVRSRPLLRGLEALELGLYRSAARVVTVTQGFADNIAARGIPRAKLSVIPNGADTAFFRPTAEVGDWRARHGLGEQFVVAYYGAHGISHDLEAVLRSAHLNRETDVRYVLAGDGAEKQRLTRLRDELALDNVLMLPSQPRDQMPALYASADACLVVLKAEPVFSTFIPSKMFEIMASGRPIVSNVQGEARRVLERSGAALLVQPDDPSALAEAVRLLSADEPRRRRMGDAGRRFVLEHYDRQRLATRYAALLEEVVGEWSGKRVTRIGERSARA